MARRSAVVAHAPTTRHARACPPVRPPPTGALISPRATHTTATSVTARARTTHHLDANKNPCHIDILKKWQKNWISFGSPLPAPSAHSTSRSDGTTETTALELPVPIPRTEEPCGSRQLYGFLGGDDCWSCRRLPCAAADSGRLASIFNLTGRLAPRYSRYSHLDQAPYEPCGISWFFSAAAIFGLAASLIAPVAAAGASCLAWI